MENIHVSMKGDMIYIYQQGLSIAEAAPRQSASKRLKAASITMTDHNVAHSGSTKSMDAAAGDRSGVPDRKHSA